MKALEIKQNTIVNMNRIDFDKDCNLLREMYDVIAEQTTAIYNGECIYYIAVMFYQKKEATP